MEFESQKQAKLILGPHDGEVVPFLGSKFEFRENNTRSIYRWEMDWDSMEVVGLFSGYFDGDGYRVSRFGERISSSPVRFAEPLRWPDPNFRLVNGAA